MGDRVIRFFELVFDRVADMMEAYVRWCLDGPTWHWLLGFILPIVAVWFAFIINLYLHRHP